MLSAYSTTSQVTLKRNTKYWGATKPKFDTVVVRNMVAATQLINVGRGSHEVAIDLASDQAQTLKSNSRVKVSLQPSTWVFWLFANNDPRRSRRSPRTSSGRTRSATGSTTSRSSSVAGPGAYQTPGIIPSMFAGALPAKEAVKQNVAKAKAALQASGQASQSVTLEYPSDLTINGVPFATLAQKVQSNLKSIGIDVQLSGSPTGTWLTSYRSGKMAFGLSLWGPDYPDPADYLTFAPGDLVGLRAGWAKGASAAIEKTAAAAAVDDRREEADGAVPAVPAPAERERAVLPAHAADAGVRLDVRPEERRLQLGVLDRRHQGRAEVVGALVDDEGGGVGVEAPPAALLDHDDVLDPQAVAAGDDDRRLVGERHAGLERRLVLGREERPLVDVHADAVAHAVAEVLAEARVLDRRAAGGVDVACAACPGFAAALPAS